MKDYYKILNISRDASPNDIKKAYRKLAIKYHPDKNKKIGDTYFKEISEAYQILINDETRKLYDNDFDLESIIDKLQNPEKAFSEFMISLINEENNVNKIFNLIHGGDTNKFVNDLINLEFNHIMTDIKDNLKCKIIGTKKRNIDLLSLVCIIGKYVIEKKKIIEKIFV
jgi:DnaJ-class molecular chaperone